MDNFDLKKFMVENKLTAISRLVNEDATSKIEAEIEKVANSPVTDDAPTKDEKTALAAEIIYDKYRMAGDEDRAEIAKSIMRAHMNEDLTAENQERDEQYYEDQEQEEIVMRLAKEAVNLIYEQPGTQAHTALQSVLENYVDRMNEAEGGLNEEQEGPLVTFGYDLNAIQDVVDHLQSKYKEGQDFELHIGRGDDLPNAVTLKNPALEKDYDLNDMLNAAKEHNG